MDFDERRQAEIYDELKPYGPWAYAILCCLMQGRVPSHYVVGCTEEQYRDGLRALEQKGLVDFKGVTLRADSLAPRMSIAKSHIASPAAKELVERYGREVKPVKDLAKAHKLADDAIREGWSPEDLRACIREAARREASNEERYRMPAEKFFEPGLYAQYKPVEVKHDPIEEVSLTDTFGRKERR